MGVNIIMSELKITKESDRKIVIELPDGVSVKNDNITPDSLYEALKNYIDKKSEGVNPMGCIIECPIKW